MQTTNFTKYRITFYIGDEHEDFRERLKGEIKKLEEREIKYNVFKESDRLLPELCINGYCVIGLNEIQHELKSFLSN